MLPHNEEAFIKLKKCLECGSLIHILKDCNCADCEIKCCSKELKEVKEEITHGVEFGVFSLELKEDFSDFW